MIQVAVVTGCHPFDVPAFHALLRSLPGVESYPQHMEDWVADFGNARARYDAVLFYNYHRATPDQEPDGQMRRVLEGLGESEQGIVLLHHGLVAFPHWTLWADICGIRDRAFTAHVDQTIRVEVAAPDHPITRGLAAWDMTDETYEMKDAGEGRQVLLTVDHSKSMRTIAWTRQHGRARVFCYQSGHDRRAYDSSQFRTVLARGLHWAAGKI